MKHNCFYKKLTAILLALFLAIPIMAPAEVQAADKGFSTAYPNTWKNTGDQQLDIVRVALSQLGYRETGSNHTKYSNWYYGYDKTVAWCALFVSWCADQANIPCSTIRRTQKASSFSVDTMQNNNFGIKDTFAIGKKAPAMGDLVFVDANGDGFCDHVGLCVKVDKKNIYTVEGNTSDGICGEHTYRRKDGQRVGANKDVKVVFLARPDYSKSAAKKTEKKCSSHGYIQGSCIACGKKLSLDTPKVTGSVDNRSITVSWNLVNGAQKFRVYRKKDNDKKWSVIAETTGSSFCDRDVLAGSRYTYSVSCIGNDNDEEYSKFDSKGKTFTIKAGPVKKIAAASAQAATAKTSSAKTAAAKTSSVQTAAATSACGAENIATGVRVTWSSVNGADKYLIYRKSGSGKWTKVATLDEKVTSYKDTSVSSGNTYTYEVRPYHSGKKLPSPAPATVKYLSKIKVSVNNEAKGIKVSWPKVKGADKYLVFRRLSTSESWTRIAETKGTDFTDKDVKKGVTYYYITRAVSNGYRGGYESTTAVRQR